MKLRGPEVPKTYLEEACEFLHDFSRLAQMSLPAESIFKPKTKTKNIEFIRFCDLYRHRSHLVRMHTTQNEPKNVGKQRWRLYKKRHSGHLARMCRESRICSIPFGSRCRN
jgi:hypothetical protein